ncbi:helix-turn-helix domain-containing protein [Yeosuana marina]|uniref:helix-turn-helix domain-containing protein n=1 Tax=Yeosuana marina TaxID=1565536 RepID=UPI00141FFACF
MNSVSNDINIAVVKSNSLNYEGKVKSNLLTVSEACNLLNKGRTTIHNWTKKGFITKHNIGGSTYYCIGRT